MKIYCVACDEGVKPRITDGKEVYPHRPDLYEKKFVVCDTCKNYKAFNGNKKPTLIPTPELRKARREIHAILDPLWQSKKIKRGQAYAYISHRIGYPYHNESLKNIDEANKALEIVTTLKVKLDNKEER